MNIICKNSHPTINFAAQELQRYLCRMTRREMVLEHAQSQAGGIRVGLMSEFEGMGQVQAPDCAVDDAISIEVHGETGCVAGVNPRSVLLAVYRYLTELGCRWVRPGADGQYIPSLGSLPDVNLRETPSYRHRGICIEGAVSEEHVRDIVDWMPKLGFNGYFIQFREAHTFFDRWCARSGNPNLQGEHISVKDAREHTSRVVDEIKKRDLLYHAVGHGWTCEPFGIGGLGWEKNEDQLPSSVTRYLAQVNGERKLWHGVALNTNLCYGKPRVRRMVVEEIADYAQKHPDIDIMHFWLADGSNNHCECEACRDTRPADFYVMMLNDLDRLLTKKELNTRIVFLIYVDLLWPPEQQAITSPERFILMFAPITRTYSESFTAGDEPPELPPFERNRLKFPSNVEENVAFLKAWQKVFAGDSFDFDYHIMWDHFKDPGYTANARVLLQDLRGLKDIGLQGYVSCQVQRAFFPTGLPMTIMGRCLWDNALSYDEIAADYFAAAFGPDGRRARDYLERLSELFDPRYLRGEKPAVSPAAVAAFRKAREAIADFQPIIERNLGIGNRCWAKSWFYLKHHARICHLLAHACEARALDDGTSAGERWRQVESYAWDNEPILHPVLDVYFLTRVLGGLFR